MTPPSMPGTVVQLAVRGAVASVVVAIVAEKVCDPYPSKPWAAS
jgi:hypothetical protein